MNRYDVQERDSRKRTVSLVSRYKAELELMYASLMTK